MYVATYSLVANSMYVHVIDSIHNSDYLSHA